MLKLSVLLLTGLAVSSSAFAADTPAPTFAKDVAPIFQEKCEACHRPGSMAPMSLATFEDALPWHLRSKAAWRPECRSPRPKSGSTTKTTSLPGREDRHDRALESMPARRGDPCRRRCSGGDQSWNFAKQFGRANPTTSAAPYEKARAGRVVEVAGRPVHQRWVPSRSSLDGEGTEDHASRPPPAGREKPAPVDRAAIDPDDPAVTGALRAASWSVGRQAG
jgi:hypothetical protein